MPFENLSDHFIMRMYESIRDEVLADGTSGVRLIGEPARERAEVVTPGNRATRLVLHADRSAGKLHGLGRRAQIEPAGPKVELSTDPQVFRRILAAVVHYIKANFRPFCERSKTGLLNC
jgi:hypothetical protein